MSIRSSSVIQGGCDEKVPEAPVAALADKLATQRNVFVSYKMMPHANHVYDNHLKDIYVAVSDYVNELNRRRQRKSAHGRKQKIIL